MLASAVRQKDGVGEYKKEAIIIYIEKIPRSIQEKQTLSTESSKVAGYEINIQKSIVFLYTSNGHVDIKI